MLRTECEYQSSQISNSTLQSSHRTQTSYPHQTVSLHSVTTSRKLNFYSTSGNYCAFLLTFIPFLGCLQKADLAFLVDSSSSIGPANFQKLETFLKGAISRLDVGADKVHVGLMQYGSYPSITFPLTMYNSRGDALKAVENMNYMGGSSDAGGAIRYMTDKLFGAGNGARGNVPRIAIVLTDGNSNNDADTTSAADKARQQNIGLIAVGAGPSLQTYQLNHIADSSDKVITVSNVNNIDTVIDQVLQKACQSMWF